MPLFPPRDPRALAALFTFAKKVDLERYCRDVVIYGDDLVAIIYACEDGRLPFCHRIHYADIVPNHHLIPDDRLGAALAANGVGPFNPSTRKVVRKMFQFFKERRWLVGHMFYTPNFEEWHFIFFDQRDTEYIRRNHWREGSHFHFVNWLWPDLTLKSVWSDFVQLNKRPDKSVHVRYDDRPPPHLVELASRRRMSVPRQKLENQHDTD